MFNSNSKSINLQKIQLNSPAVHAQPNLEIAPQTLTKRQEMKRRRSIAS